MRENDFGRRSDRSYLCLVAIYVIHALLLNVFLQPQLNVRSSVILSASYIRGSSWHPERNSSAMTTPGDTGAKAMSYSSALNSTNHAERRKLVDDDYSARSSASAFLQQPQPNGAAIRFLAASRASGVSGITNAVLDVAKRIIESLSPAALGILAGCLVFLLTFTENYTCHS